MAKYRGEVYVEIELDNEDEDAFQEAFKEIDEIMQRAHDTDRGRHHVRQWHFEMLEDSITAVDPVDETPGWHHDIAGAPVFDG